MDYREKNKGFITASKLKLFLDSPLLYKAVYVDEVPLDNIKKSPALEIGTMVDKMLLTPSEFESEYSFPVAGLKADLIKYCEEHNISLTGRERVEDLKIIIYGDKKVLTDAQAAIVEGIYNEVNKQPLWSWLPDGAATKYRSQVDLVADYKYLKIKGTLDRFWLEGTKAIIRDLKTTSQMYYNIYNDNTQFFSELAMRDPFHYKLQMAMYVWLVRQNYPDVDDITVIIDGVGTTDPYFYQGIKLDTKELEMIRETQVVPLLEDLNNLEEGIVQWSMPKSIDVNRNKLSGSQYYKLGTPDCIQQKFDFLSLSTFSVGTLDPDEPPKDFDWDKLI